MNREIKFRAWHKEIKVMKSVETLWYNGKGDIWVNENTLENSNKFNGWTSKQVELMQFTGLKDKNGTDIYEGDRIKVTDEHGNVDSGPVWYLPERASYCIVWHEGESSFSLADCKDQIEILGNIFEGDAEEVI